MIQRFFLILCALAAASGCVTTQQVPKFAFPSGTRVGIINQLEDYAIHRNFSEARIRNFTKTVKVGWNIPGYMQDELTRALTRDGRYTIVPIAIGEPLGQVIDRLSGPGAVMPEAAALLESAAVRNAVDVLVVVKSFKGPTAIQLAKHKFILKGYGLFTRQFLFFDRAYAYANLAVIVFKTNPLTYIGSGEPTVGASLVEDMKLSGNLKNIAPSEMDKLEPIIKQYARQAVQGALTTANLVSKK